MDLLELRKRVEEGVQTALIPQLMERYKQFHMKREWRDCDCSYCEEKRKNHKLLQFAPYYLSYEQKQEWRDRRIKHCRTTLAHEEER